MPEQMKVALVLDFDDKGAPKKIRMTNEELKGTEKAGEKGSRGMMKYAGAITAVGAAIAAAKIAEFGKEAVQASIEQTKIFTNLGNTIGNLGINYKDVSREIDSTLAHLQRFTRYGDTDSAEALDRLVGITGDYDLALKGLQPVLDFAVGAKIDLKTAAELAGKAVAGQMGTLSRYGIVLDEATQKMLKNASEAERAEYIYGLLSDRWGGAAQAEIETFGGKIDQLGNYWGDLKEEVGDSIVQFLDASGAIDLARDAVISLIDAIGGGESGGIKDLYTKQEAFNDALKNTLGSVKAVNQEFGVSADVLYKNRAAVGNIAKATQDLVKRLKEKGKTEEQIARAIGVSVEQYRLMTGDVELLNEIIAESYRLQKENAQQVVETVVEEKRLKEATEKTAEATVLSAKEVEKRRKAEEKAAKEREEQIAREIKLRNQAAKEWRETLIKMQSDATAVINKHMAGWGGPNSPMAQALASMKKQHAANANERARDEKEAAERSAAEWEKAWGGIAGTAQNALSDAIWLGITGELDSIGDVFNNWFADMGSQAADTLSAELMQGFKTGDWSSFKWQDGKLGAGASAAGQAIGAGVMQKGQANYNKGQAALGGALQGGAAGAQAGGWVGAIVGAIIGAGVGLFGTESAPTASLMMNYRGNNPYGGDPNYQPGEEWKLNTPSFGIGLAGDQSATEPQRIAFQQRMKKLFSQQKMNMISMIQLFDDAALFDLTEMDTTSVYEAVSGSIQELEFHLSEKVFPEIFEKQFGKAITAGLDRLGVDEQKAEELAWHIEQMSTADADVFMRDYISALVDSQKLIENLDWDSMVAEVDKNSREAFIEMDDQLQHNIGLMLAPWDQLDLVEQTSTVAEINSMVDQAYKAQLQYLGQVMQLSEDIGRSIDKQIESLRMGGMGEFAQTNYIADQLESIFSAIGQEGVAPEVVSQLTGDAQNYISMLEGLFGEDIDKDLNQIITDVFGGQSWLNQFRDMEGVDLTGTGREFLISLLDSLNNQSQDALQATMDEINERNQEYIDILALVNDTLTGTETSLQNFGSTIDYLTDQLNNTISDNGLYEDPTGSGGAEDPARSGGGGGPKGPGITPWVISDTTIGDGPIGGDPNDNMLTPKSLLISGGGSYADQASSAFSQQVSADFRVLLTKLGYFMEKLGTTLDRDTSIDLTVINQPDGSVRVESGQPRVS